MFPGFLPSVQKQPFFQSQELHASEVRGKNSLERKFAANGYRTCNLQVMRDMLTTELACGKMLGLCGRRVYYLTHYQTTNFRLFQIEGLCRQQFQIWRKWLKVIQTGSKTLWEKEKLLVTSNFSFSRSAFKRLVSQGHQKGSLCGNGLTHYHTIPTFNDPEK